MTKLSVHLYLLISLYLMVLLVKGELGDASDPTGDPTEWSFYG